MTCSPRFLLPGFSTGRASTGRRVLALGAIAAASVLGTLGFDARPDGTCVAEAEGGQVRVGIVIDYGALAGAPAPQRQCATVAEGANGFKALQAAGHQLRTNSSGLLCAIDGFPSGSECGSRTDTGYRYWAYFRGNGSGWTYSGVGPGSARMAADSVEGWHFVEGKGNPTDPPPAGSADHGSLCPPVPTTAPSTAPPPTVPPVTPPPSTAPPSTPPPAGTPTTARPGSPTSVTTAVPVPSDPNRPVDPTTSSTATGPTGSGPKGPDAAPTGGSDGTTPIADDPADGFGRPPGDADLEAQLAVADASLTGAHLPAEPGPPVVGLVLVALVGAAAVWRFRMRRVT